MTLPPFVARLLARLPRLPERCPFWGGSGWRETNWRWWWLVPVALASFSVYVVAGMAVYHVIDDDADFSPAAMDATQSRTVDLAARLIVREVDQHQWVANDPFFKASFWLDDMPNFQQGIIAAVRHTVSGLSAATLDRGGPMLVELDRAAGLLKYPGTIWKFDLTTSWTPTASSEKQYRAASRHLMDFNRQLLSGNVAFERRPDILAAVLRSVAEDLAHSAENVASHLDQSSWSLLDSTADDIYFRNKGQLYAYGLLMRELGWDHAALLSDRGLGETWRLMTDALQLAGSPRPILILNGSADSGFIPNHLTYQGFYVLLAHQRLLDLANRLSGQ